MTIQLASARLSRFAPILVLLAALGAVPPAGGLPPHAGGETEEPVHVLFVTIDTLRTDHVSSYGYERPTTLHLDRLIERGVKFTRARTIEPLTSPALCSMLTARYPHEHGSTRNGLRMRSGLPSLPKALQAHGYRTAAFVGNWTLRDKLSGLAEHFETYEEVLTRRRWFGLVRGEATAEDLTESTIDWISDHVRSRRTRPFFAWVHYVEPHAPYRLHRDQMERIGLSPAKDAPPIDRYDTEIAFVDQSIGELLHVLHDLGIEKNTIVVFASDHGESLGEHKYWGHGRYLYEPTLRIPMSITWPGRITPREIDAPSLITDLAPTVLALLETGTLPYSRGFDWSGVMAGREQPPATRDTYYQAHRGAVLSRHDSDLARRSGLLEVGILRGDRKETFRIPKNRRQLFDLAADPGEISPIGEAGDDPTEGLQEWMRTVYTSLSEFDTEIPEPLDEESAEQLKSLGYVD